MTSPLENDFQKAVERIRNATGPSKTNEEKAKVYGLYKQVNNGDAKTADQPWAYQIVERAKWEAWNKNKGKSKEQAMKEYIDEVNRQLGTTL
jgi:diazepam-binding inhibitor (GABA receptor modulating acyl-CoA-binding protein)